MAAPFYIPFVAVLFFKIIANLISVKWYLIIVLIGISLMSNGHLFMCLLKINKSLGISLFRYTVHF